ncbi:TetR/AcrR family transcriptional regulator [Microtetraspora malaysiensis]|uniref:TetR/AcrR family transcriptional regulator n=1 Tax=Microtetraspora malaysiensis TaxID=161358 RepID=UPI003D8D293A
MAEERRERADAARNREAILRATEELLARHRPEQVSMERVAAAAGVGKGTVFHRFGSRMGLMVALMRERAYALDEAVTNGPPPLGPGAPPEERLMAFLDAVAELVGRNKGLLAALGHAATASSKSSSGKERDDDCAEGPPDGSPVYRSWHGHASGLIAERRPDLDAELLAHILLGSLQSEPVLRLLECGESARLAASLRVMAAGMLAGP